MGAIMCISSQLDNSVRLYMEVFYIGLGLIFIGTASWIFIQIYNIMRIRRYQKIKETRKLSTNEGSVRGTSLRSHRF